MKTGRRKATHPVTAAATALLLISGAQQAQAQAGIGVSQDPATVGTIGSNKGDPGTGAVSCPAGSLMTGIYHADRSRVTGSLIIVSGMTVVLGVYCSTVNTNGRTAVITQLTADGTPSRFVTRYDNALPPQSAYCGPGRIGVSFGGWDRISTSTYPWASAIFMQCGELKIEGTGDWFVQGSGELNRIEAGDVESDLFRHVSRGPFCGSTPGQIVTGVFAQAGGYGYDGINVYCGRLDQGRFSAQISFVNFAWDKTIGTNGWRVNLNRNGTLLENAAGMSGANKTPYSATAPNNAQVYSEASEIFVIPNTGYQASVSARPASMTAATGYIQGGTCVAGIQISQLQDASCQLTVTGLPDLAVSVATSPLVYRRYNTPQDLLVTVKNVGPAAMTAADGYVVQATLNANWVTQNLPAGCTLSGQVVRCSIGALAAAAAPGQDGGAVQFAIPVMASSAGNGASYDAPVELITTVPSGDGNPANDDYNSANNRVTVRLELSLSALLRLSKQWVNAAVNDTAVVTAANSAGTAVETLNSTANTANETDTSTGINAAAGAVYSLSETLGAANVGGYNASAFTCTGGTLSGSQLTIRNEDMGRDVICSITNTRRSADVRVTKTSATSSVSTGQNIVWTITAVNNGPDAAANTVIRDTPGTGMDCTSPPPPTCTATNGAACPTSLTAASLTEGLPIPTLPSGGQITISLTCRATASGL